jgi:hypothetical protein
MIWIDELGQLQRRLETTVELPLQRIGERADHLINSIGVDGC